MLNITHFYPKCVTCQGRWKPVENWESSHGSASKKILLINIHKEGFLNFYVIAPVKMVIRLVFAASVCSSSLSILLLVPHSAAAISILLLRLLCVESYTQNVGGAVLLHLYLWVSNCSPVPPSLHSVQLFASSVGHGRSEGIRIDVDSFDSYVQDIVSYMTDMKQQFPSLPLFYMGHSMVCTCLKVIHLLETKVAMHINYILTRV